MRTECKIFCFWLPSISKELYILGKTIVKVLKPWSFDYYVFESRQNCSHLLELRQCWWGLQWPGLILFVTPLFKRMWFSVNAYNASTWNYKFPNWKKCFKWHTSNTLIPFYKYCPDWSKYLLKCVPLSPAFPFSFVFRSHILFSPLCWLLCI